MFIKVEAYQSTSYLMVLSSHFLMQRCCALYTEQLLISKLRIQCIISTPCLKNLLGSMVSSYYR